MRSDGLLHGVRHVSVPPSFMFGAARWAPPIVVVLLRRRWARWCRSGSDIVPAVGGSGVGMPGPGRSCRLGPGSPVVGQTVRPDGRRDAGAVREDGILVVADSPPVDRGA